jgi:hypothetical protein
MTLKEKNRRWRRNAPSGDISFKNPFLPITGRQEGKEDEDSSYDTDQYHD